MTEEPREKIRHIISRVCASAMRDCDYQCGDCKELNHRVDQSLSLLKEAGYVQLDPDQTLPEFDYDPMILRCSVQDGYWLAKQDMYKAGWRRTVK